MDKEKTCCGCCKKSNNKISPDYQSELSDVVVNQYERINGWSCPWHPLQATAWLFMIIFAISHFAILVDYLPKEWKAAGYIVPAGLLVVHVVYHLLCLSIDPSDIAVKARRSKKDTKNKATFDRTSRAHVIENLHCCICLTEVGGKSKHCSVCNKCVSDFDHHCKWLNNCVGGQNYKLFLGCIISAFVSGLAILVIDLYQFIFYFIDRQKLKTNSGRNDWKLFLPVPKEGYLAFISIIGILIFVSLCLLGHLIIFHFYLICKGMTTYEYIVHLREKQLRGNKTDIESGEISPPKMQPIKGSPKKNGKRNLIENSKEFQSTTGDEESSEHEHFEREVVDGKNQQPPSDEEDDDVVTTVPKPETIKMTTVQITPARERRTKRRENENEETPVAVSDRTKSKSRSISKQQSDNESVESLQEVSISTQTANNNHHNASLNNSRNLQKKISEAAERTSNESDNLHTNLVRNSESEKEIDVKENLKKKKKRKKKVKKVTKKELPPVLTKARRPLPQLPALCEENELES